MGRINKTCDTKGDKCDRGCFPLFLLCDIVLRKEREAGERGNDRSSNFALVEGDIVYNSGVREKIRERRMYDVRLKGNTMRKIFLTDRIFLNDERKIYILQNTVKMYPSLVKRNQKDRSKFSRSALYCEIIM